MEIAPREVLLVTPHPDDAEGGCGGTVARWIKEGTEVVYVLCTNGDKGSSDPEMSHEKLAAVREKEQLDAAGVLGVKEVVFLRHPDGTLEDDRQFRGELVREVRRHKPDVVMCMDAHRSRGHTHRDHRTSGQVTVDAVCTYAWRPLYFPEHLADEGLQPHLVKEIYLWGSEDPDTYVDISGTVEAKVDTLLKHVSQMSNPGTRGERIAARSKQVGERANLPYAEAFRVLQIELPLQLGQLR